MLPVLSKVVESLLTQELIKFMSMKNIISKCQHGFQKNKSTISSMLEVINVITYAFDKKQIAQACYCDLQKDFDCVSHPLLLLKLEFYGIRGLPLQLIKYYFENRKQSDTINQNMSFWLPINSGIPQGLILGSILFLVYIDDLIFNVKGDNTCLYADDSFFLNATKNENEAKVKNEGNS